MLLESAGHHRESGKLPTQSFSGVASCNDRSELRFYLDKAVAAFESRFR